MCVQCDVKQYSIDGQYTVLSINYCLISWDVDIVGLSGGKRGAYQNCSVLYCVLKLCTVIAHLGEQFLQFSGLGFVSLGHFIVFMFVFFVLPCHTAYVLYYCNMVGWTWWY